MSPGVLSATMNWLAVALPFRQFRDSSSPWTVRTLSPWQLRRCRTDLQEILRDAGGDPRRRGPDRIPRQMRIPGGGPDLAVPEQLGDHGQALAQRQRPRREGMPAVVNPDVLDPRALPHDPPRVVQVGFVVTRAMEAEKDLRVLQSEWHRMAAPKNRKQAIGRACLAKDRERGARLLRFPHVHWNPGSSCKALICHRGDSTTGRDQPAPQRPSKPSRGPRRITPLAISLPAECRGCGQRKFEPGVLAAIQRTASPPVPDMTVSRRQIQGKRLEKLVPNRAAG